MDVVNLKNKKCKCLKKMIVDTTMKIIIGSVSNMKNKKGFTLIELLAVIVILGLLMAIAIPSVTKYITQSRKKTVVSSIDGYISSAVNSVNDQDFKFSTPNTIYAVPIECIAVEKGGTNPFGEWLHANKDYWAYVLVQYDSENFSYNYGFTFKDSSGYGMYPTIQREINPKSSTQIKTGLELTKPTSGKVTNITEVANWNGFDVDSETNLVVLESEREGIHGNGKTTCTLAQKGSNYERIENSIQDRTLVTTTKDNTTAFWGYRDKIKNITFQDSLNIPINITDEYKWDISSTGNGKVMAYITPNANDSSYYDLYIQGDGELYANPNSEYLFFEFKSVDSINNIELLNVKYVTNMKAMFYQVGYSSLVFTLDLGDKFDTSKVTNMANMFDRVGYSSLVFTLDLGDKFDTRNVTNMYAMFQGTGYSSTEFTLDLGNKFDTSNVTDMESMFYKAGYTSSVFTLDLGDKFDTGKVINMKQMFCDTGLSSSKFTLNLGDKFDTSNVTNMKYMFDGTGYSSTEFTLDLGNKFDTSNVIDMGTMFQNTGYSSPVFTLDLGDKFNTSNVTDMGYMFNQTGYNSKVFTLDLGDKFDTSNVDNMLVMFNQTGYNSKVFTLDLGDKFDTSNVDNMLAMFQMTGYTSTEFTLDCRAWNVDKVTDHRSFNYGVESKVIQPVDWN